MPETFTHPRHGSQHADVQKQVLKKPKVAEAPKIFIDLPAKFKAAQLDRLPQSLVDPAEDPHVQFDRQHHDRPK